MSQNQKINLTGILGKSLGILWLIDGLLQLQPKMFGMDFVNNVLSPNLSGQPAFLHALIAFGIRLFSSNTVVANCIAAVLQIVIGILLLCPIESEKFKLGLYLSIAWGLVVWIFGEGLGGLFTGSASLYTGAPGAALIYALIAACFLMPKKITSRLFANLGALVLLLGAALQLQPMFWSSVGSQMLFQNFLPNSVSAHPTGFNWFLIIVPLLLAAALFFKPGRATASITILFLFLVWWLGQDFGGLSTVWIGTATDVNTAPLIMLLVLPFAWIAPRLTF
jgi:hypothetical protein